MDKIKNKLHKIIKNFKEQKIKVIGDLILDEYVFGETERISPEAPVPIVMVKKKTYNLGGAANVAWNIKALGGDVFLCGFVGNDEPGNVFIEILKSKNITTEGVIRVNDRPTIRKTRIISHNQQILRVDEEVVKPLNRKYKKELLGKVFLKDKFSGIIFEDYEKGTLTRSLISNIVKYNRDKIIACDPKKHNFPFYKGIDVLKPNRKELEYFAKKEFQNRKDMLKSVISLSKRLGIPIIILTLGEEGIILKNGDKLQFVPSLKVEVYDVTGAGDTVIATFTLSILSGATPIEATLLSVLAAV
jgi:rfaE bifunctional protein kinase chain/domain